MSNEQNTTTGSIIQSRPRTPEEFASQNFDIPKKIIEELRTSKHSLNYLEAYDLNYAYHIAMLCNGDELRQLNEVFLQRMTTRLFFIGWNYCQFNPDDKEAIALFIHACAWMRANNPVEYSRSLMGKIGGTWINIISNSFKLMKKEGLTLDQFIDSYRLLPNAEFTATLVLEYLSNCDKNELAELEPRLAEYIKSAKPAVLRGALANYTSKFSFDEFSQEIIDAIIYRQNISGTNVSIGISPEIVKNIRLQRFSHVLEDFFGENSIKKKMYLSMAEWITDIAPLGNGFFLVKFSNYSVVDKPDWPKEAYAFAPALFEQMLNDWEKSNFADDFWPAIDESRIITARESILGLGKSPVIRLCYDSFDKLYAKDLLTYSRSYQ